MDIVTAATALNHAKRIAILSWLKSPHEHFPVQIHGDKDEDGVCSAFIAEKLEVTPPTASSHLRLLLDAGLVRSKRIGKYTYYRRVDSAIAALAAQVGTL